MKEVVQLLLSVLLYLFWGFLFRSELSQLPSSFFFCVSGFSFSLEDKRYSDIVFHLFCRYLQHPSSLHKHITLGRENALFTQVQQLRTKLLPPLIARRHC
jgi:hypothetical protein